MPSNEAPNVDRTAAGAFPGPAGIGRQVAAALVAVVVVLAFALLAGLLPASFARDFLHAAGAAVLLGVWRLQRPPAWSVALAAVLAAAAYAGAGLAWGQGWQAPLIGGGAAVLGAVLVEVGLRRGSRVEPLEDAAALLGACVRAVLVLPTLVVAGDTFAAGQPPALDAIVWPALARHWLAAALATATLLPVLLTARTGPVPSRAFAGLALVAGIVAAALLAWPGWLALLALPLLWSSLRWGARATAVLGLLAALAVVAAAGLGTAQAWGLAGFPLASAALLVATSVLVTVPIAVLAGQRERAEVALRAGEGQLHVLTEKVPALVATFGKDLRHRFANRRYLQWHGKSAPEVIGRTVHEIFGERTAAAMASTMQRALAGQPQRLQLRTADGHELEAFCEPHFGTDGAIDGFQLLAQDVSWRRQGERRERALLDALGEPVGVLAADGRLVQCNDRFERLFGLPRAELIGRAFAERLAEATRQRHPALVEEAMRSADGQRLDGDAGLRARRGDGSEFPVELAFRPMPGEDGLRLVVVVRDRGERVADERALREAREQAQVTLDAMADAVVVCDAKLRITGFNPMAATLTGWSAAEAIGRPLDEVVALVDPAVGQSLPSLLHEALRTGKPSRVHDDRSLVRRDGSRCPVEESAAPIRDVHGMVSGGVLAFHDVSQARAASESMSHLAQHDFLTNLPNRVLLQDRLQQALARVPRGDKGALLYLDLDKFKPINDTLGHPVGDKVLQEIARRLVECVREDDTVSRQGGDEFVLLLVRLADPRDVARVAEKLITAIEQPIRVDGQDLFVGASIGIALFPQDGRDTKTLMKQADTALYHAKETGRGRYCYFTDTMSASAEARMRTEHDLRFALANDDFFLVYQPRLQLPERRVAGIEALVRWRREEGVSVPLEEFIPVAEETGLVVQIDEWVMRQACRQARLWQDQGLPPLPVSVNVSLSRFDAERLLGQVRAALAESGLAPGLLEIEFREGPLFAQGERGQALVARLKALGVRVAVDDYGSGASGIGALAGYRFDTLKIDRGFIAALPEDAHKAAITQAIVSVGRALGIAVVAKGVETHPQAEMLVRQGCSQVQGFLYSGPLDATQVAGLHRQDGPAPALRQA